MSASPIQQVNGTKPSFTVPIYDGWRPVLRDRGATVWEKGQAPEAAVVEAVASASTVDLRAEAEADAIRARTAAEQAKAAAEVEAIRIRAEADRQRAELAAAKAAAKAAAEIALAEAETARVIAQAEAERIEREAAAQAAAEARKQAAETASETAAKREKSAGSWRLSALVFAAVCGVVALPVQMSAFYSPDALWLLSAPFVLEGGAWVVLRGAAAAVDDHRPHWHYRLIAWCLAIIAAGINLAHGWIAFDPATALGTAFASLAGPGVWDLHEHGRIRKRDGVLTRKERRAKQAAAKRAAKELAAAEAKEAAEKEAAEGAAQAEADRLAVDREEEYPEVWARAKKCAAALGETTVTQAVWERAWYVEYGAELGVTVDDIHTQNAAERRVMNARNQAPTNTPSKVMNAQRASHLPPSPSKRRYSPPATPGVRRKGDAPKFVKAARNQASIAAKNATADPAS